MPEWLETFLPQAHNRPFQQISILETTAGECHASLAGPICRCNNAFHEGVVETSGNLSGCCATLSIPDNCFKERKPIENQGRIVPFGDRQRIRFICFYILECEFQVHRRLAFKFTDMAESGEGGHGIKQSAHAAA